MLSCYSLTKEFLWSQEGFLFGNAAHSQEAILFLEVRLTPRTVWHSFNKASQNYQGERWWWARKCRPGLLFPYSGPALSEEDLLLDSSISVSKTPAIFPTLGHNYFLSSIHNILICLISHIPFRSFLCSFLPHKLKQKTFDVIKWKWLQRVKNTLIITKLNKKKKKRSVVCAFSCVRISFCVVSKASGTEPKPVLHLRDSVWGGKQYQTYPCLLLLGDSLNLLLPVIFLLSHVGFLKLLLS